MHRILHFAFPAVAVVVCTLHFNCVVCSSSFLTNVQEVRKPMSAYSFVEDRGGKLGTQTSACSDMLI